MDEANGKHAEKYGLSIDVSKDAMEAYLTILPQEEREKTPTADDVRQLLAEMQITSGVKSDVIESMIANAQFNSRTLIAEGTKSVDGSNGTVHYVYDFDKPVVVKRGEKIGDILPPEDGAEGRNVYGAAVPIVSGSNAVIPELKNIVHDTKEKLLTAGSDGYLTVSKSSAAITPFFDLTISDDHQEASVTVTSLAAHGGIGPEDLTSFLKAKGVVFGIMENAVEELFGNKSFGHPVLVAQGKRVIDGADGKIHYNFQTHFSPKIDDQGNVDYKELELIQNVKIGDRLAEIVPPTTGEEGTTVLGETIQPKTGSPVKIHGGKNTSFDSADENVLISSIEGCVKLADGKVTVEPVVVIPGNVDYTTGNINFIGSVVINKDVKSGFKVKAKGDIQIDGVVEDAEIQSGGDVLMKMGFIGKGSGRITAKGIVHAKFCENETIVAEGDVNLADYAINSTIRTKSRLIVTSKHGMIIGGESSAVSSIETNTIGNPAYVTTKVSSGVDAVIKTYIADVSGQIAEIERILVKLLRRKLVKKELPEKIKALVDQLEDIREAKEKEREALQNELELLPDNEDEFRKGSITANNFVYPGAVITIYDTQITINDLLKKVVFRYIDGTVAAVNL